MPFVPEIDEWIAAHINDIPNEVIRFCGELRDRSSDEGTVSAEEQFFSPEELDDVESYDSPGLAEAYFSFFRILHLKNDRRFLRPVIFEKRPTFNFHSARSSRNRVEIPAGRGYFSLQRVSQLRVERM
jgi:hypothetical protein